VDALTAHVHLSRAPSTTDGEHERERGWLMPTDPTDEPTTETLLAELRELCQDVGDDDAVRARRLTVLRRLERRMARGDRPAALVIA
jgi:hypothetical protein